MVLRIKGSEYSWDDIKTRDKIGCCTFVGVDSRCEARVRLQLALTVFKHKKHFYIKSRTLWQSRSTGKSVNTQLGRLYRHIVSEIVLSLYDLRKLSIRTASSSIRFHDVTSLTTLDPVQCVTEKRPTRKMRSHEFGSAKNRVSILISFLNVAIFMSTSSSRSVSNLYTKYTSVQL